jgi:hypothetical protein
MMSEDLLGMLVAQSSPRSSGDKNFLLVEQIAAPGRHGGMDKMGVVRGLVAVVMLGAGGAARGAPADQAPLLVIVEPGSGADLTAADARRAIGAELARPLVAPSDATAADTPEILLVAVGGSEIRMSLRGGPTGPVSRAIPAPAERAARLRALAWLAGNVARDQASQFVAAELAPPAPSAPAAPPTPPPTPVSPAPEPPPTAPVEPPAFVPAATVAARPVEAPAGSSWAVGVLAGPTASLLYGAPYAVHASGSPQIYGFNYQLEALHRGAAGSPIFGAVLEGGAGFGDDPRIHVLGVAALAGVRWQRRRWSIEATVGASVEGVRGPVTTTNVTDSSTTGTSSSTTVSVETVPVLYTRASALAAVSLGGPFELVAGLGVHLTTAGLYTDFATFTSGIRMRLP